MGLRKNSANHHYVPQAILRNFAFDGDSIFYFSKRSKEKGVERRNVASIFKKRHLNSYIHEDGTRSDPLEDFYSRKFDSKIVDFVESHMRFSNNVDFIPVDDPQKLYFVQFLYNLMKRTPEFHDANGVTQEARTWIQDAVKDFEREVRPFTEAERLKANDPKFHERVLQNARVDVLSRQPAEILDLMATKRVCFARPVNAKKTFVIGSNPVIRLTNDGDMNLETGHVELWAPLAPQFAVGLVSTDSYRNVFFLSDSAMRHFNQVVFSESIAIASISKQLLDSLISPR